MTELATEVVGYCLYNKMKRSRIIEIIIAALVGAVVSIGVKIIETKFGLALGDLDKILGGITATGTYIAEAHNRIFN